MVSYLIKLENTLMKLPGYLHKGQFLPTIFKQFLQDDRCPHFLLAYIAVLVKHILQDFIDYYSILIF